MSEEKAISTAAPQGEAAEPANTGNGQNTDLSSNASEAANPTKAPADTSVPSSSEFDPQTTYTGLLRQFETVNKSYGELRKEFTRRTQYESELKKQIDTLTRAFAEATKEQISPEDFIKNIQTQGINALNPLRDQWQKEISEKYDGALSQRDQELGSLKINFAIMQRQLDSENYPDFAKLRPLMYELATSENCPVNMDGDVSVALDSLYKMARSLSMETAVKEAEKNGQRKAEAQLAKEAATSVVTGGKSGLPADPSKMSVEQLRQHFVSRIGESE